MPTATETHVRPELVTTREPVGPSKPGDPGSLGDKALTDALIIICICWVLLFALVYSLRSSS